MIQAATHPTARKKVKNNCTCDNMICSNTFYRNKWELDNKKNNYCSQACNHEDMEVYRFIGTVTLYKDGHRSGTGKFESKEQLKDLMKSMDSKGKFETFFKVEFKN